LASIYKQSPYQNNGGQKFKNHIKRINGLAQEFFKR